MRLWSKIFQISCKSVSAKVEDLGIALRVAPSFYLSNTAIKWRTLIQKVDSFWQHTALEHNSNNDVSSIIPNSVPDRRNFSVSMLLVLHLLCASCVNVHCHSPQNVAENIGGRVFMNCSSDDTVHPCQNMAWTHYAAHNLVPTVIFMGGRLSSLVGHYISIAESNDGHCNLEIKTLTSVEGKYECFSTSNGKKESASLIILAGYPECVVKTVGEYSNITCSVKYFGDWAPTIEWIAMTGQNSTSIRSYEYDTSNQIVSAILLIPRNVPSSYKCIMKFNEQGRKTNTTASNVPDYEWTSLIFGVDGGGEREGEKVIAWPLQMCSTNSFGFNGRVVILSLFLWLL